LEPLYEEYADRILIAFYKAHQDPQYPGVRAHGLPGIILATDAGIVSTDEWQARDFWTSRKRWDIVAALRELMDKGYIKRTEDDTEEHVYPDQWNFRLTPQGKDYARRLLNKSDEQRTPSPDAAEPSQRGPKYQINITDSQGIVIGDGTGVTQVFGKAEFAQSSSPSSHPKPWLVQVKGEHRVYLVGQDGIRHWVPDGPTLESIARWEDIDPLASWEELEKFPPGRPLPSTVQGVKPWLVKVRGETEIYLIDEGEIRHRVLDQAVLKSINQRTGVDLFATWKELKRFQPGEPLFEVALRQSDAETTHPSVKSASEVIELQLQHLADNIRQDLTLLKEYEDTLRYEDDPRRRAKYRREIEQLRKSAARYRQEYEELRAQATGEPSGTMRDVADQLQYMDAKLDALLAGQKGLREDLTDLRQALLTRFDVSEQALIAAVVEHLDQGQLVTIQSVLDAIEAGHVPDMELQETLDAVQQALSEMRKQGAVLGTPALTNEVEQLAELADAPRMDVKHRLKVTVPIIPLILSYEGEIELGSELNLEAAWQRLVSRLRGAR